MDRRKALATAGAVTGTLMAATLAAAANFGLLGFGEHGGSEVGKLRATRIAEVVQDTGAGASTTTVAPDVEIRYEDVPVPVVAGDDHGSDGEHAEPGDDHGGATTTAPGTVTGDATVTTGDGSHDAIDDHRDDHHDDHASSEHAGAEDDD